MALSSGKCSFRVFEFDADLPADILDSFRQRALPPLDTLSEEPLVGWVSPLHLMDSEIVEATCRAGKYIHLNVSKAVRKVPGSLLRAYCKMEELAVMKENGVTSLSRADRKQIKDDLRKQMLPKMPPTLTGSDVAIDPEAHRLVTDSTADKQNERIQELFAECTHSVLKPMTPASVALRHFGVNVDELDVAMFTPDPKVDFAANDPGLDFLTWLFYRHENGLGEFTLNKSAPIVVALDGPVQLHLEGEGAHRTGLSDGDPLHSVEIQAALMAGKKIRSVKMLLKRGEEEFSFTLDGPTFTFRGAKLPKEDENRDDASKFADGMMHYQTLIEAFFGIYGIFLRERTDPEAWNAFIADFRKWLPKRHVG